jgi:hypothetical protein
MSVLNVYGEELLRQEGRNVPFRLSRHSTIQSPAREFFKGSLGWQISKRCTTHDIDVELNSKLLTALVKISFKAHVQEGSPISKERFLGAAQDFDQRIIEEMMTHAKVRRFPSGDIGWTSRLPSPELGFPQIKVGGTEIRVTCDLHVTIMNQLAKMSSPTPSAFPRTHSRPERPAVPEQHTRTPEHPAMPAVAAEQPVPPSRTSVKSSLLALFGFQKSPEHPRVSDRAGEQPVPPPRTPTSPAFPDPQKAPEHPRVSDGAAQQPVLPLRTPTTPAFLDVHKSSEHLRLSDVAADQHVPPSRKRGLEQNSVAEPLKKTNRLSIEPNATRPGCTAAESPETPERGRLKNDCDSAEVGSRVQLHGLKNFELNGLKGACETWDEGKTRWTVRLEDGQQKMLKPENLVLLDVVTEQSSILPAKNLVRSEFQSSHQLGTHENKARALQDCDSAVFGSQVQLHGLKTIELNGLKGTCETWDEGKTRWHVRLEDGQQKMLKPENLMVLNVVAEQPSILPAESLVGSDFHSSPQTQGAPTTHQKKAVLDPQTSLIRQEKLREIFDRCDRNNDGAIDRRELILSCRKSLEIADFFQVSTTIRQEDDARMMLETLFRQIDNNGDHEISWAEFLRHFRPMVAEYAL